MTLLDAQPKSNVKVSRVSPELYKDWRAVTPDEPALREAEETAPPERLLQQIWEHQRLRRDQLTTFDAARLKVLHPGFWNHEAGPDFRGAMVQFDDDPPRSGDVEIDLQPAGWRGHGHDRNPDYRNVLLHVVWDGDPQSGAGLPTVALRPHLDAPLDELRDWFRHDAGPPGHLAGQCSAPLRGLSEEVLREVLHQAALTRLRHKAAALAARARQAGWDQALWEGLFAALGYKNNVWPMRRVAELIPRILGRSTQPRLSVPALQARLFGVAGLLPGDLTRTRPGADRHLRQLWDHWWRDRAEFSDVLLPHGLWRFHGLRPANHPQRRLALAAHWLAARDLPDKLQGWFADRIEDRRLESSLLEVFRVEPDDFWSRHWTFRSARTPRAQPLLGATRVADLAVNVVLPWLWMRAATGGNADLRHAAQHRYLAWPCCQDNAVLRLARQRLLGGPGPRSLRSAAMQQGLLQIVRDFCEHSNALCQECLFPGLVRRLVESQPPPPPAGGTP